jgi:hypothetical protein
MMRRNAPDKRFLIGLLCSVGAGGFIFARGFKPAKTANARQEDKKVIPDKNGMLMNSELLGPKDLKRRSSVNLLGKR